MGIFRSIFRKSGSALKEMPKNKPQYEVENQDPITIIEAQTEPKGECNSRVVTNTLIESLEEIEKTADNLEKGIKRSVTISLSETIITAPNIPIIGDIVYKIKKRKKNAQVKKAQEILIMEDSKTDSTVKAAIATNSFTGGKSAVKTKAAIKGDPSNQREQGGEVRTRKGR